MHLPDCHHKLVRRQAPGEFDDPGVVEDGAGKLWLATWGGGIHRLDPKTGEWKACRHKAEDTSSLIQDSIFALFFDRTGLLWAGTENPWTRSIPRPSDFRSAVLPDWQTTATPTGAFTVYRHSDAPGSLTNDAASSICVARNGAVWAGTANGLNRFDEATRRFTACHESDGLGGMSVNGIQEDERGNLWVATNRGLSRFDLSKNTFQNYYHADGIPSDVTSIWTAGKGKCS